MLENNSETLLVDVKDLEPYIEINKVGPAGIQGRILSPIDNNINELKEYFYDNGFIPYFDKTNDLISPHIIRLIPADPQQLSKLQNPKTPPIAINLVLFIATVFTTLLVGAFNRGGNPFHNAADIFLGIPFSFSLLLILTGHELGHYVTSRRYGVSVTLPYFLPIPHPLIGTMGAFIRIKSILPNHRALVRIGATGPIIGFILALPITIIGIALSKTAKVTDFSGGIGLGSSLLFRFFSYLLHPHIPQVYDLVLHPMAFAGWLGFFVTAMNLLPLGQLDGGHIAYAIFGKYRKYATIGIIVVMALLGLLWPGWFFWVALIILLGLKHPKSQDEITQIKKSDKIIALTALVVLILAFIPVPFPIK
jgi:membrane-associated protease RseP (regulator of RpoE activity)